MKRYYLRHRITSPFWGYLLLAVYCLGLIAFTLFIWYYVLAEWQTIVLPIVLLPVGCWVFLNANTYYCIDPEACLIWGGNDFIKKPSVVARMSNIISVEYLPHCKEVKLATTNGTDYLKLKDGEAFVAEIEQLFEKLYPEKSEP